MRTWLTANLPADLRDKVVNYRELTKDDLRRWHRNAVRRSVIVVGFAMALSLMFRL